MFTKEFTLLKFGWSDKNGEEFLSSTRRNNELHVEKEIPLEDIKWSYMAVRSAWEFTCTWAYVKLKGWWPKLDIEEKGL